MKKLAALMICLVLLLAGCAGQQETETKYILTQSVFDIAADYQQKTVYHFDENWNETGYTVYTNEEVEQEVTYTRDENDNLIMTMVSGGQSSTVRNVYTKDADGKVLKLEMYQDDTLYSTTDYTYDADGICATQTQTNAMTGTVITISFTPEGKILSQDIIGMDGLQSGAAYTYDESGNEIKMVNYYTANGQPATTENITEYGPDGRRIKVTTTDYDQEGNVTRSYYTEYTYDGNVETSQIIQDGEVTAKTVATYDDAGNLLVNEHYSPYSDFVSRFTYTYEAVELPVE